MIIYDESTSDDSFTTYQDGKIIKIMLSRYNNLLEIAKANMRNIILQHYLKRIGNFKEYEYNIPARLNSFDEFSDFASRFRAYSTKFMEGEEEKVEERSLPE